MLIDDLSRDDFVSALGTTWKGVSDPVMGGISRETLSVDEQLGKRCLRLSGHVGLENKGGFMQMALDLEADSGPRDDSSFTGVRVVVRWMSCTVCVCSQICDKRSVDALRNINHTHSKFDNVSLALVLNHLSYLCN